MKHLRLIAWPQGKNHDVSSPTLIEHFLGTLGLSGTLKLISLKRNTACESFVEIEGTSCTKRLASAAFVAYTLMILSKQLLGSCLGGATLWTIRCQIRAGCLREWPKCLMHARSYFGSLDGCVCKTAAIWNDVAFRDGPYADNPNKRDMGSQKDEEGDRQ